MTAKKPSGAHVVANPHGVPPGTRVLAHTAGGSVMEWFEGDGFTAPDKMSAEMVAALVAEGVLVPGAGHQAADPPSGQAGGD